MKVVHLDKNKNKTKVKVEDKDKEGSTDLPEEAKRLEKTIRSNPGNDKALNRLMVIYRKLKEAKKELKVINKGIDVFKALHDKKLKAYSGNDSIGRLSKALLKSVSGETKKQVEYPQPVQAWTG